MLCIFSGKSIEGGNRDMVGLPPLIPDWEDDKICHEYLDEYPYHLTDFAKMGYKTKNTLFIVNVPKNTLNIRMKFPTMVAQDYGPGVAYYPHCMGFNKSEADHIWRPFDLRIEESTIFRKSFEDSCSERHLEMLDYLQKFMNAYAGTPKIAQVWPTWLAHDTMKNLFHADEHFLKFFKKNRAQIDRSFFFFLGDHGPIREGIGKTRLGRYEGLNPFLMVLIPSVYRNTPIHFQLRQKTYELMTHFDIHATIVDILKIQPAAGYMDTSYRNLMPLSKGSSFLREWRGPRNCRTLPIPSHYCICDYEKTNVNQETLTEKLGWFFAEQFNKHLFNHGLSDKCQMQSFNSTASVRQIKDGLSTLYDIVVYLVPSGGLFSAHIRSNSSGLTLSSGFIRLDRYGRQGDCLVGNALRSLCHCKGTTVP
ncbi:hypothetical protein DICVIV_03160 [Dictyocaulus viviparus]|uniref:Sulfatase N-terminal domain-containing protein n=1 Tax=Dictyocaulus viviparus TaxID=29172 RepID=A0A0D8Y406_DICVI|nr:hypothetical protein DICVIV_03160 [Dictyocaulus viviparus]